VDRVNQYPLYDLGKLLQAVSTYKGDVPATAPFFDLFAASGALDNLLNGTPFPISISRDAVVVLRTSLQNIWNEHYGRRGPMGPMAILNFHNRMIRLFQSGDGVLCVLRLVASKLFLQLK
jgi:hypothetical protein